MRDHKEYGDTSAKYSGGSSRLASSSHGHSSSSNRPPEYTRPSYRDTPPPKKVKVESYEVMRWIQQIVLAGRQLFNAGVKTDNFREETNYDTHRDDKCYKNVSVWMYLTRLKEIVEDAGASRKTVRGLFGTIEQVIRPGAPGELSEDGLPGYSLFDANRTRRKLAEMEVDEADLEAVMCKMYSTEKHILDICEAAKSLKRSGLQATVDQMRLIRDPGASPDEWNGSIYQKEIDELFDTRLPRLPREAIKPAYQKLRENLREARYTLYSAYSILESILHRNGRRVFMPHPETLSVISEDEHLRYVVPEELNEYRKHLELKGRENFEFVPARYNHVDTFILRITGSPTNMYYYRDNIKVKQRSGVNR